MDDNRTTKYVYYGQSNTYLEHGFLSNIASRIRQKVSSLKGREMPNHKYIRREMLPNGKYKYVYDKKSTALSEYRKTDVGKATAVEGTTKKRRGVKYLYKERTSNGWRYYYENKSQTLSNLKQAQIKAGQDYANAVLARKKNDNAQTRAAEEEARNAASRANFNASIYEANLEREAKMQAEKERRKEQARHKAMDIVKSIKEALDKRVTEKQRKKIKVSYGKATIERR